MLHKRYILKHINITLVATLLASVFSVYAGAAAFDYLNYQGRLRENGQPVSGSKNFKFILRNTNTNTWISIADSQAITVSTGIFSTPIRLDRDPAIKTALRNVNNSYALETSVWSDVAGNFVTLNPETPETLACVPYALVAETLYGKTYDAFVDTSSAQTISGNKRFTSVGINAAPNPGYPLTVGGTISAQRFFIGDTEFNPSPWSTGTYAANQPMVVTIPASSNIRVGIGLPNPGHTLDVNGTINAISIYKNGVEFNPSSWTVVGNGVVYNYGNVGIGTTANPVKLLQVNGDVRIGNAALNPASGSTAEGPKLTFGDNDNVAICETAYNYNSVPTQDVMRFSAGRFVFGGGNNGYVGINLPPDEINQIAVPLVVNGDTYIDGNMTVTGSLFPNVSDISLKKNITVMHYGLSDVMKLQPKEFDLKSNNLHKIGLIAQEVEPIIPEVVGVINHEGKKGIAYQELTSVLIKAVQEQQKQIEDLKKEVEALKARLP
jgi:hypothetical protein